MHNYTLIYTKDNQGKMIATGVVADYDPVRGIKLAGDLIREYPVIRQIEEKIEELKQEIKNETNKKINVEEFEIFVIKFNNLQDFFDIQLKNTNNYIYEFSLDSELKINKLSQYIYNLKTNDYIFIDNMKEE